MGADIFALAETWLKPDESITFDGYDGHFASHGLGTGVATFSLINSILMNSVTSKTFSAIHLWTENFETIVIYMSSDSE